MRETLFRGKDTESGEWLYGWVFGEKDKSIVEINTKYISEYGVDAYHASPVIPETVGQYIGLDDKNGVKIFEGDVVIDCYGKKGYVAFLQQEMGYSIVYEHHDSRIGHRSRGGFYNRDHGLEVIGNVDDNPELVGARE